MAASSTLPVTELFAELDANLVGHTVVLEAPPGAGKSTALPLHLLQQPHWQQQRILLLQPRRIAAVSIAHYLAKQLGERVGQQVGYQVRGEQRFSADTRLLIVTEGIFVQYLQNDPELQGVGCVIFDEFHERNLSSDLGLAMLLEARALRDDLSLLIMSASLPAQHIADWLGDARVLTSAGRQHPVTIDYRPVGLASDWLTHCAQAVAAAVHEAEQGVLVFLPGWREIERVRELLPELPNIDVLPLHRQLSLAEQEAALSERPAGRKKVVLATNIAETSLTIPGIDMVVDSGRERRAQFYPKHGVTRLTTARISKAAALQRCGRAGRLGPGKCWRLWSQADEHGMRDYDAPAIATDDLSSAVLESKRWGSELQQLQFFTPPNAAHIAVAEQLLQALGVLDGDNKLTAIGQQVAALGNDPRLARIAIAAQSLSASARSAAALLLAQLEVPIRQPRYFPQTLSQLSREAKQRWRYWLQQLSAKQEVAEVEPQLAFQLAAWGYPDRVAQQRDASSSYLLAYGGGARFHQQDARTRAPLLLILTMTFSDASRDAFIDNYLALSETDLEHPALPLAWQTELEWVGPQQRLQAIESLRLGAICLRQRVAAQQPSASERAELLVTLVQQSKTALIDYSKAAVFLARVRFALAHLPSVEAASWPAFDESSLTAQLASWAAPYWSSLTSLRDLHVWSPLPALQARLDYAQQQRLAAFCPTEWLAPSGHKHKIDYREQPPKVALKLQEVFGEPVSPTIADGKVNLLLELLSPAGRPLQRTADLASFWQNSYQQVKKEMKGRYPKHPWPDDPLQAIATRKTKSKI